MFFSFDFHTPFQWTRRWRWLSCRFRWNGRKRKDSLCLTPKQITRLKERKKVFHLFFISSSPTDFFSFFIRKLCSVLLLLNLWEHGKVTSIEEGRSSSSHRSISIFQKNIYEKSLIHMTTKGNTTSAASRETLKSININFCIFKCNVSLV